MRDQAMLAIEGGRHLAWFMLFAFPRLGFKELHREEVAFVLVSRQSFATVPPCCKRCL